MTRLVKILNDAGAAVTSGVTVASTAWEDVGGGTPSASVSHVADGLWRITVTDPATPRGPAGVTLSYNPGSGTVTPMFRVADQRLTSDAITDAAFGWHVADSIGMPSTAIGRLRRFVNRWFFPRQKNRTTKVEVQFAEDGVTPLHQLHITPTVVGDETIDTVTLVSP